MSNYEKENLVITSFLGYRYRKNNDLLYSPDGRVAKGLINLYYSVDFKRLDPNVINRGFVERYIKNESAIESVHEPAEVKGLELMYEDMTSMPFNEFELFSIISLHKDLYSRCPHPEAGGKLRTGEVFLPGTGTDLCPHDYVFDKLLSLEDLTNDIKSLATYMKETNDYEHVIDYIESCVKLNCELIKVHPFEDGNGRTVRCFINKLFEGAGIPPVYIKVDEKYEYNLAMNKANNEGDYNDITSFYLFKICDSIMELDINKRVREEREEKIYDIKSSKKKKKKKRK